MEKQNLSYAVEIVCRNGYTKFRVESKNPLVFEDVELLKDDNVYALVFREMFDTVDKKGFEVRKSSVTNKYYIGTKCLLDDIDKTILSKYYAKDELKRLYNKNIQCVLFRDNEFTSLNSGWLNDQKFFNYSIINPSQLDSIVQINSEEIMSNSVSNDLY